MVCCNGTCKKWCAYILAIILLILGIVIIVYWGSVNRGVLYDELSLKNNSKAYKIWSDIPIPMYLSFYLYNWTNADEVVKDWNIKPKFVECGPYVYREYHERVNVTWTANDTITYSQRRIWHYQSHLSQGSLEDNITTLNIVAATFGSLVKDKNILIQKAADFILNREEKTLILTKTVKEWIFDGFEDELLNLAKSLNISGLQFDRFGWFYGRNNSDTYDGKFTMYTGANDLDLLGLLEYWNNKPITPAYDDYCGIINGTVGELWPPVERSRSVSIFSSDLCSSLKLFHNPNVSIYVQGLEGKTFEGTEFIFDNGTKYPEQKCFKGKTVFPSGVRDISRCRFGAPAFLSYPHFLYADPIYLNEVSGLRPNATKHKFVVTLEPKTGVPLKVKAQLQINFLLTPIKALKLFKDVKQIMFPMLWFSQSAELTENIASDIKVLLILPNLGYYTAYGFIAIGILITLISTYLTVKKLWFVEEDQQLLSEKAL